MPRVTCVSFNQDGSRLALGFDKDDVGTGSGGFCVFSCEPVSLESCSPLSASSSSLTSETSASTAVTSAALLYKTRVSAFVLASRPNVVELHDGGGSIGGVGGGGSSSSLLGELSFPASTKVLAVALRRDAVAVALSDGRAAAYSLDSLRLLRSVETGRNEFGLLALAAGGARTIFACPSGGLAEEEGEEEGGRSKKEGGGLGGFLSRGSLFRKGESEKAKREEGIVRVEFVDAERSVLVRAARHGVAALALSQEGELLATASERGTLVRVFSLGDESSASGRIAANASEETSLTPCLRELRRGGDPARMLSLAFSSSSWSSPATAEEDKRQQQQQQKQRRRPRWLAAASDRGTVHVWGLSRPPAAPSPATAAASHLPFLAAAAAAAGAPYPSSLAAERSLFHFKLQHEVEGPMLAALSFSPGGKAVLAASAATSSSRCGLVAVALPEEGGEESTSSSSSAAAELFCVPDLFALLPR